MKKLLVAAIGAAAAIGAFADTPTPITALRFESATVGDTNTVGQLDTLHDGSYWSDTGSADNTYVIESAGAVTSPEPLGNVTKALNVKTKFGNPLSVNVVDGGEAQTIGADGIYFDSLVKFTVCDDCPTNQYEGAKIVMWLQEDEDLHKTNLYVNAGFLSCDNQGRIAVSNAIYKCGTTIGSDFADNWHRVTIKAIANITTSTTTSVPGFAIFIDGSGTEVEYPAACTAAKWDESFTSQYEFAEAVEELKANALFPSLIQGADGLSLSKASFDGTGSITDIAFYNKSPAAFADDFVAKKASVTIGSKTTEYTSLEAAVAAAAGQTATIQLMRGLTLNAPLVFNGAAEGDITFDFAGKVLTNAMAACAITNVNAAITVVDSGNGGGIRCMTEGLDVGAFYNEGNGSINIAGGCYWGKSVLGDDMNISVTDGKFDRIAWGETDMNNWLASTKKFSGPVEGLYSVADKVSYTVTFMNGEAQFATTNVLEGTEAVAPSPAPEKTGYTFAYWYTDNEAVEYDFATPVTAALTLNAKFTANTYTIKFAYGEGLANTGTVANVAYGTTPSAEQAWEADITGMEFTSWSPTIVAATADAVYTAQYSAKQYTVTFYTNSVEYATATYTYGDMSTYSAPADPSVDGYTFGGWFTDNSTFEATFVFSANVAGNTQVAYAKLTQSGGGSGWDPDPSVIPDSKTAAQEYPALDGTPLATANAKKLTIWATANSVTLSDAKSATTPLVESYLLNCAPADLEAEKAAFKLNISFDGSGNPVVTLPDGKAYNVTPTMKGSNDLSTWKEIDSTTGYQFFKYELSL